MKIVHEKVEYTIFIFMYVGRWIFTKAIQVIAVIIISVIMHW